MFCQESGKSNIANIFNEHLVCHSIILLKFPLRINFIDIVYQNSTKEEQLYTMCLLRNL